jgi:predicted metal-dependent hydrolase
MAVRKATIPEVGTVMIYKRRRTKSIRLSITHDGSVRVTIPAWAPYKTGIEFVQRKSAWIRSKTGTVSYLRSGDRIGKAHQLLIEQDTGISKIQTRIVGTEIRIRTPEAIHPESEECQLAAKAACIRALKREAEQLLPRRLEALASQYDFTYNGVKIKQLRSRWGSCNHKQEITLNCFLMQLPWHLIDYVLLHELLHTEVLAHGPSFWGRLDAYVGDLKNLRKEIKSFQPALIAQQPLFSHTQQSVPIPIE